MLMTEATAATKWCPMVRHNPPLYEGAGSFNRGVQGSEAGELSGDYHCTCIASKCAMWRWGAGVNEYRGYCGLAGWLWNCSRLGLYQRARGMRLRQALGALFDCYLRFHGRRRFNCLDC